RPRAPGPRRADRRSRPGGHPGVPCIRPRARRRGPDRVALVPPARRGRADLRRGRDRRQGPSGRAGLDRRPGGAGGELDPRRLRQQRARTRADRLAGSGDAGRAGRRRTPRPVGAERRARDVGRRDQPPARRSGPGRPPPRAAACVARADLPRHHEPAGGRRMTTIAGALIGASMGADDLGAGVFRELVVTGRSRAALYLARIPAGLAVIWSLLAAAFTIATIFTVTLAGSAPTPSAGLIVESGLWLGLTVGLAFLLGLGLGSLLGSRAPTIAILFAWVLILEPLFTHL